MFFKIIGEISGSGPFVADYMKILARDGAVGEMDLRASPVHAGAAKSRSLQRNGSIASPILRVVILAPNCEADRGRVLPFPFPEKFGQIGRDKRSHRAGTDCTIYVQTKIAWTFEEIGRKPAGLMSKVHITEQRALAIPGKIGGQIGERHHLVSETCNVDMADDLWSKRTLPQIC